MSFTNRCASVHRRLINDTNRMQGGIDIGERDVVLEFEGVHAHAGEKGKLVGKHMAAGADFALVAHAGAQRSNQTG